MYLELVKNRVEKLKVYLACSQHVQKRLLIVENECSLQQQ